MFFTLRLCLNMMFLCGVDPRVKNKFIQNVWFALNIVACLFPIFLSIYPFLVKEHLTFADISGYIETLITFAHVSLKLLSAYLYKDQLLYVINLTEHFWKIDCYDDEEDKKILIKWSDYIFKISKFLIFISVSASCVFLLSPWLNNEKTYPFKAFVPENYKLYQIFLYTQFVSFYSAYLGCVHFDILFCTIILLGVCQLKLLNKQFHRLLKRAVNNDEDKATVKATFKKYLRYHAFLLDYLKAVNEAYLVPLFLFVMIWILTMCTQLFNISKAPSLAECIRNILYVNNMNFEFTIYYCIPCEFLTYEIERIHSCLFDCDWEKNFMFLKLEMLMIMMRAKKSRMITAGKFMEIGIANGLIVMKTALSYYMFLANVNNKKRIY